MLFGLTLTPTINRQGIVLHLNPIALGGITASLECTGGNVDTPFAANLKTKALIHGSRRKAKTKRL